MVKQSDVRDHVGAFGARLKEQGYAPLTYKAKVRIVSQFAGWAEARRLQANQVNEHWIDKAVQNRPTCRDERRKTLHQFLDHLREMGVAPPRPANGQQSPS